MQRDMLLLGLCGQRDTLLLGLCETRAFLPHTLSTPADMDSRDHLVLMVSPQHLQQFISALPWVHSPPIMATVITECSPQGQRTSAPCLSRAQDCVCTLSKARPFSVRVRAGFPAILCAAQQVLMQ